MKSKKGLTICLLGFRNKFPMKLISLNTWGGKLLNPLLDFLQKYKNEVDLFCFQEIYNSPQNKVIRRGMRSNLFTTISEILKNHRGIFTATTMGYDIEGIVNFKLDSGLAIFYKEKFQIEDSGNFFIFKESVDLLNGDSRNAARKLQYINFQTDSDSYLISTFHGIWYRRTKIDTEERILQSGKINSFLAESTAKKVLCGDFNLLPTTKSFKMLEKGLRNLIEEYKITTTRNKHYKGTEKFADYVLVSPDLKVSDFKVLPDIVSDHQPLFAEFE